MPNMMVPYHWGVENLRKIGQRPFTIKENIQARVEAYESGDKSLFRWPLDSCSAIVYEGWKSDKFKIVNTCAQLINLQERLLQEPDSQLNNYHGTFLRVRYKEIEGVEFSRDKIFSKPLFNYPSSKEEVLEHPGWRALMGGDTTLLRCYLDIVSREIKGIYPTISDNNILFRIKKDTPDTELRPLYIDNINNRSSINGEEHLPGYSFLRHL